MRNIFRRCAPSDAIRKRRARNSDDSVQDPTLLETLSEETSETTIKTSEYHLNSPNSETYRHRLQSRESNLDLQTPLEAGVDISMNGEYSKASQNLAHCSTTETDSSASNSSGNSSVGLQLALKTGDISCSRRGRIKSCNETNKSSQDTDRSIRYKHPGRRCNRDSGYNDDAFFACEPQLSPTLAPTSITNCPVNSPTFSLTHT